jgi:hypothetical protein
MMSCHNFLSKRTFPIYKVAGHKKKGIGDSGKVDLLGNAYKNLDTKPRHASKKKTDNPSLREAMTVDKIPMWPSSLRDSLEVYDPEQEVEVAGITGQAREICGQPTEVTSMAAMLPHLTKSSAKRNTESPSRSAERPVPTTMIENAAAAVPLKHPRDPFPGVADDPAIRYQSTPGRGGRYDQHGLDCDQCGLTFRKHSDLK